MKEIDESGALNYHDLIENYKWERVRVKWRLDASVGYRGNKQTTLRRFTTYGFFCFSIRWLASACLV